MIQDTRLRPLNDLEPAKHGKHILYWMQQSQRASFNPALEHAIELANERDLPVLVAFVLWDAHADGTARSYAFMLEGLRDVAERLDERRIGFTIRRGHPPEVIGGLSGDAAVVVCDRGYLRLQKRWRKELGEGASCRVDEVEGDVVVPVETVSDKSEYAARTIRPKLHRVWDDYLIDVSDGEVGMDGRRVAPMSDVDPDDVASTLGALGVDDRVPPVTWLTGGTGEARRRLSSFIRRKLDGVDRLRSEPAAAQVSTMSPYLHFGQISPVEIALKVRRAKSGSRDDHATFLEELIVRRELSMNRVAFEPGYDRYRALPDWARATLSAHRGDRREHMYSRSQLEAAETHDRWWNAAMREMVHTGYMHNYMRMYWAKKILEWSNTPEHAFRTALYLNNRYFIDGRDANSYANVGWCFGLHDRPWKERPIFGKVRYMSASGLERKFDMAAYERAVDRAVKRERRAGGGD